MNRISPSALGNFETCSYMGHYLHGGYGEDNGKPSSDTKYTACGTCFHNLMDLHNNNLIQGLEWTLDGLHDILEKEFQKIDISLFDDEDDREAFRVSLHEQLDWISEKGVFIDKPFSSEQTIILDGIIDGIDLPFKGIIDRVDFTPDGIIVSDWKTGRTYTKKELSDNMQAVIYCLLIYKTYGQLPKEFNFYFSKFKKVKTIKPTEEFMRKGIERVNKAIEISKKPPETNPKSTWWCKHFCDCYKDGECPMYKKKLPKTPSWDNIGKY